MKTPLLRNPRTNLEHEPVVSLEALRTRRQTTLVESCWADYEVDESKAPPTPVTQRNYSDKEDAYIRAEHAKHTPYSQIASVLGRSPGGLQKRVEKLGLAVQGSQGKYERPPSVKKQPWRAWTPKDEQYFLAARGRGESYRRIGEHLGRREAAVRSHAYDRKTAAKNRVGA